MKPVYLHGRSLVSALGANLQQALAAISAGGKSPQRVSLPGGTDWPYFGIGQPDGHARPLSPNSLPQAGERDADSLREVPVDANWRVRAQQLICAAISEAGLESCRNAPLFIATSSFNIGAIEAGQDRLSDCNSFAEEVAVWLGWNGPVYLVSSACVSSLQAILAAHELIGAGYANDAVVLGVELFNRFSISGFAAMQLLTPGNPKPLGSGRDGIVLGEAVAALHLSNRRARWHLCGGSNIVDGRDPTGAIPQTVTQMCYQSLASSGLVASDIGLIKLQAAGSPTNDVNELAGLADAFDPLPPLVTLKAAIGHTLGASGAAEIALLTACLEANVWPHTDYPPDPALHAGLAHSKPESVRYILADILGFGGGHTAVILEDTYGHL
ncbi:MAG TPA: beta-ketoacyl synthase N-terminal-like domain-containing protein [Gallionella sp.]|nr:beta-ketoacyl synthase N-terminal-like domain-containing protein [Gallionella sp.]